MKRGIAFAALALCVAVTGSFFKGDDPGRAARAAAIEWPRGLPVYDHVVIVVEENKDYEQIIDSPAAPYINTLRKEGANFTRMFGEEHHSQGNYFWMFSGDNQGVGFRDGVPDVQVRSAPNLGAAMIAKGLSFKGYAEDLPAIGSQVFYAPERASGATPKYGRKHVPWVSFGNVPNGGTVATSSNLRFADFPTDTAKFQTLPTVAFVIPNLQNDMHDGKPKDSVPRGDAWLKDHLDAYYRWAKTHNSLLIITFDENDDQTNELGLTDPFAPTDTRAGIDKQNRICTLFAGAHVNPGDYQEGKGITHVNILRTLEAMYGLPKAGGQQPNAARGGITDDFIITDVFER
jgi:acid phosphatase